MNNRLSKLLTHTIGAVLLTTTAFAQQEDTEKGIIDLEGFTVFGEHIDTVNVATRLPLSDIETPQTISLIDASRLENESMFTMDDVMRNVTGVNVSLYDTQRPLYFSRGFKITDFQVDGIPSYSNDTNQEYDTALYQRVEILRGANGLFSGSGEPSGTVNFIRKKPYETFETSVHVSLGSWNYYRGQIDANVPLTKDGRFNSRFVVAYTDRDSFRDRYHEEKLAYLATFSWKLSENTKLTMGYQFQDNEPTASVWGTIPPLAADGSAAELPHTTNFATDWAYWKRESGTLFANLEHKFSDNWHLIAAYNHTEGEEESKSVYGNPYLGSWLNKSDGTGVIISGYYWETEDTRDSIDVYINGKFELLGQEHDLVLGASHSKMDSDAPNTDRSFAFYPPWYYEIPNFYTWNGSAPEMTVSYLPGSYAIETEQTGFYASTRLKVTDELSVILGARITNWDSKEFEKDDSGKQSSLYGEQEIDNELTPYVGFTYDLPKGITLYGSYTNIFEPQNYLDVNNNFIDPIEGYNIELGVKARFANDRATFTAAVFEAGQDNFAVVAPGYETSPDPRYYGVDGTKSEGVELQVSGLVTDDWSVIFGYTYVNTSRHSNDPIWTNLPESLVQLSTHYQFPGAWRKLALGAGFTWQSEINGTLALPDGSIAQTKQDAYALVNVHLNYEITKNFSATLSVKNGLDEIYFANLDYPNYGEPRNVIFTLKWRY